MLTGEPLSLFLDKDAIRWGDVWREKIDSSLSAIAFFVAVITPRYLMSSECRREFQFFIREAAKLGYRDLILPLLYVDVAALHSEVSIDDVIVQLRGVQWEDWTELRFEDINSSAYRRAVYKISSRMVDAMLRAEKVETERVVDAPVVESEDDEPGILDHLELLEATMPELNTSVAALSAEILQIGEYAKSGLDQISKNERAGKGLAGRMSVARKLSVQLSASAERVWTVSNTYAAQLHDVDSGFRTLIEHATNQAAKDGGAIREACVLFKAIKDMAASARFAHGSVSDIVGGLSRFETLSRELRPPSRLLRQGFTLMIEGQEIIDEWVRQIDRSGIDCDTDRAAASQGTPA